MTASGPPQAVPPPLLLASLVPDSDGAPVADGAKLRRLGVNIGTAGPAPFEDYQSE